MADVDPAVAGAKSNRLPYPPRTLSSGILILVIALAAVISRAAPFGDPVAHVDDEFYLLTGQAILHGQWPYVDIWDRKPIGLFLLYAAMAWMGGSKAIIAVQLTAGIFAAATALTIARIGERIANRWGGLLAGIAYLVCLPMFGGQTGQSPVFYNLLMAVSGLLVLQSADGLHVAAITRRALVAMLLCGLSITIKQVSFVEGAYFGLAFLWLLRRAGATTAAILGRAAAMVVIALAPTALALGVYAAAGHGGAFVFANFASIFLKSAIGGDSLSHGLKLLAKFIPPILVFGLWDYFRPAPGGQTVTRRLLLGWIVAAVAGYLFVPYFFNHYALPMLVPLSASAATVYGRGRGYLWLVLLTLYSAVASSLFGFPKFARERAAFAQLAAVTKHELRGGCLYVPDGQIYLYVATDACRLTPYVFPDHLLLKADVAATGIDPIKELRRIFAQKPAVVAYRMREPERRNPAALALIDAELKAHYRKVPTGLTGKPRRLTGIEIWSRTDRTPIDHLPVPPAARHD